MTQITEEITQCIKDPIYFMKNYCYIEHPIKGKIKIDLFPYQEKIIQSIYNEGLKRECNKENIQ